MATRCLLTGVERTWAATASRETIFASDLQEAASWNGRSGSKREPAGVKWRPTEIGVLRRDPGDLTSSSVGLSLAEAKALLAELQKRVVQTQIDEYIVCARVCTACMKLRRLRDQRSRTLQTLFGTVRVAAPRAHLCSCLDMLGMATCPSRRITSVCQTAAPRSFSVCMLTCGCDTRFAIRRGCSRRLCPAV